MDQTERVRLSCAPSPSIPLEPAIRSHRIREMQEYVYDTKLYVGNLPYDTTESDLQARFAGGVKSQL